MKEILLDENNVAEIMIRVLNINPFLSKPDTKHIDIDYKKSSPLKYPKHWSIFLVAKYSRYKTRSEKNGKGFSLDFQTFEQLFKQKCVYCGGSEIITIDRINSNIGYHNGNVVSCCNDCNILKSFLGKDKFLKQISRISNFLKKDG